MNFIHSNNREPLNFSEDVDLSRISFPVEKRPLYFARETAFGTKYAEIDGQFEIVRTDTWDTLGVVGRNYEVSTYDTHQQCVFDALEELKWDNILDTDDANYGFEVLEQGAKLKTTIELPKHTIKPVVGDVSSLRFVGFDSMDGSWRRYIAYICYRYWCENGCASPQFNLQFRTKHTKSASSDETIAKLKTRIKDSVEFFNSNEKTFAAWANTRVVEQDVMGVFGDMLASYRDAKGKKHRSQNVMDNLQSALWDNAKTWGWNGWSAYNAATDWATHIDEKEVRGAVHNAGVVRNNKVAKMLTSPAWNQLVGTPND